MSRAERQLELAREVRRRDEFAAPLRTVAGFAARFDDDDGGGDDLERATDGTARGVARVAAVLLDADTLAVLDRRSLRSAADGHDGHDAPDFLAFGVLPALLQALAQFPRRPDLAFVGGHGLAHPRRLGLASHFGVAADLPCIGVASEAPLGTAAALHEIRGAHTPLRDGREQVGWLLRSRPGAAPLVVSPGHRVSMTAAAQLVMRFIAEDRLPEPIRLADALLAGENAP